MTQHTTMPSIVPESSHRFDFVGHNDQGGAADGVQVMVSGGNAYVAHVFSGSVGARRSQLASASAGEFPRS